MFEIIISDEFGDWFKDLDSQAKKDIFASIETLKNFGPSLGSKINNLKELRVRSIGRPFRILFLFDPKKRAFLLIGGNKANDKKFYKKLIAKAEIIYSNYKEI